MKTLRQYAVIEIELEHGFETLLKVSDFYLVEDKTPVEQELIKQYKTTKNTIKVLWRDF